MSEITPIGRPSAASLNRVAGSGPRHSAPATHSRGKDQVQLSDAAQLLSRLNRLPEIRQDLVNQVRGEIANGTYETPEKIDALLSNLAEDLL